MYADRGSAALYSNQISTKSPLAATAVYFYPGSAGTCDGFFVASGTDITGKGGSMSRDHFELKHATIR